MGDPHSVLWSLNMKRLPTLAATGVLVACALMTAGCITVFADGDGDGGAWHGDNAQPFDAAREDCHARTDGRDAFRACMAEKGWTRS